MSSRRRPILDFSPYIFVHPLWASAVTMASPALPLSLEGMSFSEGDSAYPRPYTSLPRLGPTVNRVW